ncbi:CAP domain-containing protein [Streptomyces sp. NPDC059783]|uniref:CAP domain-containing protein n=1 Tax=Streptomyces sp. NPDC059783 TaxID=3346944 RepID=UPI003666B30A
MGRHRRSAAAPAAEQSTDGAAGHDRTARRGKLGGLPMRTGLLGVSAAVAVGAVAVATGLIPGSDSSVVSGGPATDRVRSEAAPNLLSQDGGRTAPADRATSSAPASRGTARAEAPARTVSPKAATSSAAPSTSASASPSKSASPTRTPAATRQAERSAAATKTSSAPAAKKPTASAPATRSAAPAAAPSPSTAVKAATAPASPSTAASAEAAVLALVNQERAKVGCTPVKANNSLASLAQSFSDDMAARGFFDHTDPDGKTPWDRASAAGVSGLGGENIARGQADAQAVMDAWMASEGHRANILNCDYTTLGVGVHFGAGGPWWTQDFGF